MIIITIIIIFIKIKDFLFVLYFFYIYYLFIFKGLLVKKHFVLELKKKNKFNKITQNIMCKNNNEKHKTLNV